MQRLVVFHYHLQAGGVTSVVRDGLRALFAERTRHSAPVPERLVLVTGEESQAAAVRDRIAAEIIGSRPEIEVVVEPRLAYRDPTRAGDTVGHSGVADQLMSYLLDRLGGDQTVWWIHNHHLGKNVEFTNAILSAAGRGQRCLLQIHDFPEAGRLANLRVNDRFLSRSPYPIVPNVRYAVINARDRKILAGAGIPDESLFLLENPVAPEEPADPSHRASTIQALAAAFGNRFPSFQPGRPTWFYPVRDRRRKNAVEAALLATLAEHQLILTLPAVSSVEVDYSNAVAAAFGNGSLAGLYGIGPELDDHGIGFRALIDAAHGILCSSIQEGFGYLFLNAVQWRLPLITRELDVLGGIDDLLRRAGAYRYDSVLVPIDAGHRARLQDRYRAKVDGLAGLVDDDDLSTLSAKVTIALESECVEFSYLDWSDQIEMTGRLGDPGFRRATATANRTLLDRIDSSIEKRPPDIGEQVDSRFGQTAFARRAAAVLGMDDDSWGRSDGTVTGSADQARITRAFATLDNLRLLYGL